MRVLWNQCPLTKIERQANLNVVCGVSIAIRVERAGGRVAGAEEEVVEEDAVLADSRSTARSRVAS